MLNLPLVRYVLLAAVRDKIIMAMAVVLLLVAALSVFLGSVSVMEQSQFSIVFAASGLRVSVVLGLVLFVSFYVRRSFDSKDIEFLLTRPISRLSYVSSVIVSFMCVALFMTLVQGVCLLMFAYPHFQIGQGVWLLGVLSENMMMVGVAFFFPCISVVRRCRR